MDSSIQPFNNNTNHLPMDSTLIKMIFKQIQEGDLNIIKQNIIKYSIDMKILIDQENHQNAYFYAALIPKDEEAFEVCKYFKSLDVDPLFKDKHSQTCLYYTAREGKYLTSKFLIEECEVPINEKDIYGQNPIYYSCREGHLNLCELFIEKGTDVNLEDKFGQTCIFYAIRQGHYEIVEYLIKNNADLNKIDNKNNSPLSYAEKQGQNKIVELLAKNGAYKPEPKSKKQKEKKSKNNNKKTPEEEEMSKQEIIENLQKPKKNLLVKINENGEKKPLNEEEIKNFKEKYPNIAKILFNKEEIEKLTEKVDEELKLHENWEKNAKKIITTLWKSKESELFHKPVDPLLLGIPDYFNVIKHPMDFSTIKKKLTNFTYTNFKEFTEDMNLVFDNCYKYNGRDSQVGNICTKIKNEYNQLYQQLGMDKFL